MTQGTAEVGTTVPPAMSYIKQVGQMGYLATSPQKPTNYESWVVTCRNTGNENNETHSLSERATTVYRSIAVLIPSSRMYWIILDYWIYTSWAACK